MFYVRNIPILKSEIEVLQELKRQLTEEGRLFFANFIMGTKNIQFNCPFHSDGQERKPSCGITIEHKENSTPGVVHCFSCGAVSTLTEMVSYCFGYEDGGDFGTKWLSKTFVQVGVEERQDIRLDVQRVSAPQRRVFITDMELDTYRYTHPYMYKRRLTEEIIEKFDIGYDYKTDCITFPVKDGDGNTLFIMRRNVKTKFINYPPDVVKPVYGVSDLLDLSSSIIVCESAINALTCYVYGKQAVALLGLGTKTQYKQLEKLSTRHFIAAFDGDEPGRSARERFMKYFEGKKLVTFYDLPEGQDINDLTEDEFKKLVEYF